MPLAAGSLGHIRILGALGAGGMGEVFDDESPATPDKYWFGVTGTIAGGNPWSLDPELINRPGT